MALLVTLRERQYGIWRPIGSNLNQDHLDTTKTGNETG